MPLIAAYTPAHWEVTHIDEIVQKVNFDFPCDLVGITANTPAAIHAYSLATEFRKRGRKVVIGGPHATLMPEEVSLYADSAVIGEADDLWPKILEDFEKGKLLKIYKCDVLPNLQDMPSPRWDLIKGRWYGKGVTIATRGCPFACEYCTIPQMYSRKMRYRPVDQVIKEISNMPGRALIFWDDNLAANKKYSKELFKALIPLKRWWTTQATMDCAEDDEFLDLAAKSGCKAFFMGFESVSQASLISANKSHNNVTKFKETIRKLHSYGIAVQAGIVFGFDEEDKTIFKSTVEYYNDAGLDSATISVLIPFPNTPIFKKLDSQGRILTRDWSKYDGKKNVVYQPAQMTPAELLMGMEWAARRFYSLKSIKKRMSISKTGLWWNVPRNLGYHLALRNFGDVGYDPSS